MAKLERYKKKNLSFLISTKSEHPIFYSLAIPMLGIQQGKCIHWCNKRHV